MNSKASLKTGFSPTSIAPDFKLTHYRNGRVNLLYRRRSRLRARTKLLTVK